jgi:hypothetical protein
MIAKEQSARLSSTGVPEAHHPLSHHDNNPELIAHCRRSTAPHAVVLAVSAKLRATPDGDGSLLDHMTILWSGISNSTRQSGDNLCCW